MALELSTGAVNYLTSEGSLREMLDDVVMCIYSGTAPADADSAPGGTKLCKVTKASGAVVTGTSDYSTPQKSKVVCTDHDDSQVYDIDVTIDGVVHNIVFDTHNLTDHTLIYIAAELAKQANEIPGIRAVSDGVDTVYIQGSIGGLAFTLADGGCTVVYPTVTTPVAAARVNTIQFGPPTAGVIAKTADVWSGVNLATGVAGFFRFQKNNDTEALSTTDIRIQGTVSTSGSDYDMSNTTLTLSATHTVDSYTLTEPKEES